MAQNWVHRQALYRSGYFYTKKTTGPDWINQEISSEQQKHMYLDEWLDYQCKGGWELFKISLDRESGIRWCLFRKMK